MPIFVLHHHDRVALWLPFLWSLLPRLRVAVAMMLVVEKHQKLWGIRGTDQLLLYRGLKKAKKERGCTAKERYKMPPCTAGKRGSIYRGVTRHRWTGRYEAHFGIKFIQQYKRCLSSFPPISLKDGALQWVYFHVLNALTVYAGYLLIPHKTHFLQKEGVSPEGSLNIGPAIQICHYSRYLPSFLLCIYRSRWDLQFGRVPGADYFNSLHYGDNATVDNEYIGGFCMDRKIDLSSYIKWWAVCSVIRVYKRRLLKRKKKENDENENKSTINRIDRGKMIEKSSPDSGSERFGSAFQCWGLSINRNLHPLTNSCSSRTAEIPIPYPVKQALATLRHRKLVRRHRDKSSWREWAQAFTLRAPCFPFEGT
ncbi:hypothetical protein HAX54_041187 [Datura stramonium]|uniref:Uncharacterized protein n=1 Tax=Datura stramonium TaxID=4076 RepID=A0ABS8VNP0_DATST|nr:hypothetical protein [Datura stramonium]